ncbi:MAG: hypothetical protein QOF76_2768 [Solirubrobacteraceae bacterium]|nr:hypothetical protein [Solirubrobacteraceae bacterium]
MERTRVALVCAWFLLCAPQAFAAFPYKAGNPNDYTTYKLPTGANQAPDDFTGKLLWMYAATADANADPLTLADKRELGGIRGASLVDNADVDTGWRTTTGRPDVTLAILDSGIKWDDRGAMLDDRHKTRINTGEAPVPKVDRATATEAGQNCATFTGGVRDANGDGIFNIVDYACDTRVDPNPAKGVGPSDLLDPQDILIAFSDGVDDDHNGYTDDLVGWDFLDNDNDPYDDVQYGHGTGESRDSSSEADNGGDLGTCPNCTQIYLRVGTSFVADVNRFAEAAVYATDNHVSVIQEALGTLNKSKVAGEAIKYAYDHGTTVIASAADEAAQHHNWPSSFPYSIVVNSVTHTDEANGVPGVGSYLQFNGCTNFSSRITLAIPSVSCSSDATGRASGMAGLVYSAALNAIAKGNLTASATCHRVDGSACPITPNQVRQVMASGIVDGTSVADDVNFAQTPAGSSTELACLPVALPACTDPFLAAPTARVGTGLSYPARKGHDQFYGYGRVNMVHTLEAVDAGTLPPSVEIASPNWFDMVDPGGAALTVTGQEANRAAAYTCKVLVAPGSYAGEADFTPIPSTVCNGTPQTGALDGTLGSISMATLKGLFPATAGDFTGREPGTGAQTYGGRPDTEPYGFIVKVVATSVGLHPLVGQDRRQAYLHHDAELLPGYPKQLDGDGEASPVLADLDGDNQNELVLANSDGDVYAFERDGGQVPGFPVHTGALRADHAAAPGWGALDTGHEAVLATPAVGDLDGDGVPEIVVADLDGAVRVFGADGTLKQTLHTNPAYAGIPQQPFVNLRHGHLNRTQPGFIASPVLADLDGDGKQEIIAAAMDRHVYAWHADGSTVVGWPVLVVDRSKVASIDPMSHAVTFKAGVGADFDQGAIIDTPAVGDLDGDGKPEVVVGTNEAYTEPVNAGGFDQATYTILGQLLEPGNSRLFAIKPGGEPGGPSPASNPYLPGWPFKVGIIDGGILPLVGEGVTGSPIIGNVSCNGAAAAPIVGTVPAAGLPYLVGVDGKSCYGQLGGLDRALPTSGGVAADPLFFPAFGHPAFAKLAGLDTFLAPAAGLIRAADIVLPEYQGGRDYLAAWNTATGQLAPGWPAEVNDLQFLTGPSVADIDAVPGQDVLDTTANLDLQALNAAGKPISTAWPKLTGDWSVAIPVSGPWGAGDKKVVVSFTRGGRMLAYGTAADACAPGDWPQFHHDPANSGDARRDAVEPGHPTGASLDGTALKFTATGDDLQCGTAAKYQVVTSDSPITAASFAGADALVGSGTPGAAGAAQTVPLVGTLKRYIAVRAVDEQGNVGRPAVVDRGAGAPVLIATATPTPGATVTPSPSPTATPTTTATPDGCRDARGPRITRATRKLRRHRLVVRGRARDRGCAGLQRVRVSVTHRLGRHRCRSLRHNGTEAAGRPCARRTLYVVAKGLKRWKLRYGARPVAGRYVIRVRARDKAGNRGRVRKLRLRIRG